MNAHAKKIIPVIFVILNATIFLEIILAVFFYYYKLNTHIKAFIPVTKSYYNTVKNIIQFDPKCGKMDHALGYTLKPGHCRFKNIEFDTEYSINRYGLRDDEDSLTSPDIIILGDSYTMGWGVEQDESFSSILEKKTGKKVLNAGVSSYGTARESLLLDRLETQNLKHLIIQYCDNDHNENMTYINNQSDFSKITRKKTLKQMREYGDRSNYKPFGFTINFFNHLHANFYKKIQNTPSDRYEEFQSAMSIISDIQRKNPHVEIVFFEVIGANSNDFSFDATVNRVLERPEFLHLKKKIKVVNMAPWLSDEDYFIVDNHLNHIGHKKVAEVIFKEISTH